MKPYFLIFLTAICVSIHAQNAVFQSNPQNLITYPFSDPNPMPSLVFNPKIYPYHKFEGYSVTKDLQSFDVIRLENKHIVVEVLPGVGGKVWGAIDKSNGNEFIYKNEVIKFRDIAMRGPWTSGGIEFNFGIIGHHPGAATSVDYHTETLADGTQVCTVGTIDLASRTQWRVRIELAPNKAAFTTKATWYNPTPTEKAYYNWMTAAAAAKNDLVFTTPGNAYLKHNGNALPWPEDGLNRNLAHYAENNFDSSKSYHVVGTYNDFFGGYYKDDNIGFGHWGRYDEIPGQKLWLWALSRFGGIWEDLLTDSDGQYIEYQAGRLFVQYFPGTENPISQATFEPHQTDLWTEVWFPIKNTNGLSEASALGALNVISQGNNLDVFINPFVNTNGKVSFIQGEEVQAKQMLFNANDSHQISFNNPSPDIPYTIKIEALDLNYESVPKVLKRPFSTPKSLKGYESNAVLFQKGNNAQRYREFSKAEEFLLKTIENDKAHLEARTALGALYFDKGQSKKGLEVIQMGLGLDTYHAGLNYVAGINYLALDDLINAKESFGWAARSSQYRTSAYAHLSQISLLEKKYKEALHYANQALDFNSKNVIALCYRFLALKTLGKNEQAPQALKALKQVDPLHHLLSFEAFLENTITADELLTKHRSEFPHQTFLELALLYHNAGFQTRAIHVLEHSPKHMLVDLWHAYLTANENALESIFSKSVDFVFPFRQEGLSMIKWVNSKTNHWKAGYLMALNLMGLHQKEKGREVIKALGSTPNTANFYWIRSQFLSEEDSIQAFTDLQKAYEKAPKNWRIASDYASVFEEKNNWNKALKILEKNYKSHPQNFVIGLRVAHALNQTYQFDQALSILNNLEVLPYEHATGSRKIYTNAHLGSALEAIKKANWSHAKSILLQALAWPEKLGVGKPFDAEERLTLFLMAFVAEKQNENATIYLEKIASYSKQNLQKGGKNILIGLYAIQLLEGELAAKKYAKQLHLVASEQEEIEKSLSYFYKNSLIKMSVPFLEKVVAFVNNISLFVLKE